MPAGTGAALETQARELLIRRRWWIAALLFVAGLINYFDRTIVSVALPVIGADLHLGPERRGILLSAFFWSYALMQIPIGWLSDRMNLRWLYAGCFALWSLTCGLTGFAGSLGAAAGAARAARDRRIHLSSRRHEDGERSVSRQGSRLRVRPGELRHPRRPGLRRPIDRFAGGGVRMEERLLHSGIHVRCCG